MSDISDFSDTDDFDNQDEHKRSLFSHWKNRKSSDSGGKKKDSKDSFKIKLLQKSPFMNAKQQAVDETAHKNSSNTTNSSEETANDSISSKKNGNDEHSLNDSSGDQEKDKLKIITTDVTDVADDPDKNTLKSTPNYEELRTAKSSILNKRRSKLATKQNNANTSNKVTDCVMSPPEFFVSHIYHDNKVFMKKYGHSTLEYQDKFYIYGGINDKGEYSDDFLTFSYGINTFQNLRLKVHPGKRAYASMTLATTPKNKPCLLLFGGLCAENSLAKDCYIYDFSINSWYRNTFRLELYPELRYGHASTFCSINKVTAIWGGIDKNSTLLNTGHTFSKGKWTEIVSTGPCPEGRVFASLVWLTRTVPNKEDLNFLYLFGGDLSNRGSASDELWMYSFQKKTWTLIMNYAGEAPCARWKHGAALFDKKMWIFGGLCSGWFSNYSNPDLYVYDIPSNCWFQCQLSSKEINCCYDLGNLNFHSRSKAFFLFGGKSSTNDSTAHVCRFAPLCTIVCVMAMRNDINQLSNSVQEVKEVCETCGTNIGEMQKIIHDFGMEIKEFKGIFELLTKSIKSVKEEIEDLNKQVEILKNEHSSEKDSTNLLQDNLSKIHENITLLMNFRTEYMNKEASSTEVLPTNVE